VVRRETVLLRLRRRENFDSCDLRLDFRHVVLVEGRSCGWDLRERVCVGWYTRLVLCFDVGVCDLRLELGQLVGK
jgi:hypothetical protein